MYKIKAYEYDETNTSISQLTIKREWMDNTQNKHAYNCFPVSLANTLGWGISFPEDISFIWDGVSDSYPGHVKFLSGEKYCDASRGSGTISLKCNIILETEPNTTILTMPVPNQFIEGVQAFTTLVSTSFYPGTIPIVLKIMKPMQVITIKAGTPVVSVLPISLSQINDSELLIMDNDSHKEFLYDGYEYGNAINEITRTGKWSGFYRNGTDHKGNKIGSHELKKINLVTKNA